MLRMFQLNSKLVINETCTIKERGTTLQRLSTSLSKLQSCACLDYIIHYTPYQTKPTA